MKNSKIVVPFLNLTRQYQAIKLEMNSAIQKVLDRGDFILGEEVGLFEKEFAAYCGVKYAVGVANGADAILLSLRALGIGKDDEVIAPVNTFISSVLPVLNAGAKVIFVDNDPQTYNIDVNEIEKKITKKTKAIIAVHLYGQIADMERIKKIAREHKLFIIEDAAQAHGATYKGKRAGNFSDIACYSFYPGKNLGAYGDAGAIVTNRKSLADKVRILGNIGQKKKYLHDEKGYNSRLDTIQAAVLRVKLKYFAKAIKMRREIAAYYTEKLAGTDVVTPIEVASSKAGYHLYVIRTKKRDELLAFLKSRGIICILHYPVPLHLQKSLKDLNYKRGDFPIAEKYAKEILSLPFFPELTKEEANKVVEKIKEFYAIKK